MNDVDRLHHGDQPVVLVTGATGFLGGNLARALARRGERVRVLVRGSQRPVALDGLDHERIEGDVRDREVVGRAVRGCRHVYHAAAALTFWCRTREELDAVRQVNVDGTRNVLEAAAAAGVERVLHVSTVDTIGLPPPGEVADETTDWSGGRIENPYAATKREAEAVARAADVETVIVNPTFLIGPYDGKPSSGRLLLPLTRGRVVVYPTHGGNNFVDVRDAVQGALAAVAGGRAGERYILGGVNLQYRDLFARTLAIIGRRAVLLPLPLPLAVAAGTVFDAAAVVTRRDPVLPRAMARLAFADHYYNSARAERELGWRPAPIEPAIRDAFAWYRSHGMAP